jgi:hypothetical protein
MRRGRVAQLGERLVRNEEAEGSNPFSSTKIRNTTLFTIIKLFVIESQPVRVISFFAPRFARTAIKFERALQD